MCTIGAADRIDAAVIRQGGVDGADGVDTAALLLGDRVQDFDRTQPLLVEALCDAVCVGEQHGLHAVRLLVEDLL
ncbi:hypothetical protein B484DRAFT_410003 [Ochromonadaceae sp. CCMP2298]|nr:hypothetical protein B484DRAFT_410003 [Ochromonadaceae sp. CCMP2298]